MVGEGIILWREVERNVSHKIIVMLGWIKFRLSMKFFGNNKFVFFWCFSVGKHTKDPQNLLQSEEMQEAHSS